MGNQGRIPWLCPGPAPAAAAIMGIKPGVERSIDSSILPSNSAFQLHFFFFFFPNYITFFKKKTLGANAVAKPANVRGTAAPATPGSSIWPYHNLIVATILRNTPVISGTLALKQNKKEPI